MSILRLGSDSPSEKNVHLLNHSLQLHLDSMSDQFTRFISGGGGGDQLFEHVVLVCQHVNDHCVVGNPLHGKKTALAFCRQADVQKVR